jgi:surface antigen
MVVFATPLMSLSVDADQVGSLQAQRQQLQQQSSALGPQRAQALAELLDAEEALQNLQNELEHNAAYLADLQRQQAALQAKIDTTRADIAQQRALLEELTRGQYKKLSSDDQVAMIFSSGSFGELVNNVMASQSINRRISDTARKLRQQEAELEGLSSDLRDKQDLAAQVQAQLEQENGRQLALVADHDARVKKLDADQRSLAGQIAKINKQIAAAQAPRTFSSGSGNGGSGSSCGNHFTYGYCTWYVANRRCIPWFGNAEEWYANARSYGYPTGKEARVGAVAVWGSGGGYGGVGHVAYVESVQADGFTVSEYNYTYGWNHYDTRFVSYGNAGPLYGFIYGK